MQQKLLLIDANKIDEYPITIDDLYSMEYEYSEFDRIEAFDDGVEYVYADLFDIDMIMERGKTPEMDTLDYIYWELKKVHIAYQGSYLFLLE